MVNNYVYGFGGCQQQACERTNTQTFNKAHPQRHTSKQPHIRRPEINAHELSVHVGPLPIVNV